LTSVAVRDLCAAHNVEVIETMIPSEEILEKSSA
jgi:hypothetical protein